MRNVKTYDQNNFNGGLNNTDDPGEIKDNEAAVLENWDITNKSQLVQRSGLTQVGDTMSAAISGLHAYLQTNGTKDLILTEGTNLRYYNSGGGTFDALDSGFTAGEEFAFANCPINNKMYVGNEDNYQHSWDRAATTLNSCLTDLGTTIPHGNWMVWHKNHMFVMNNVTVSGTAYPNRAYWSAIGDPDTYDTTNDFFNVPGQGRVITAVDMGDYLIFFKDQAIQYLDGWGDSDWRITATSSNVANFEEAVGIAGVRAMTRVGNECWFMDDEGNIRRIMRTDFDAFRQDIISTKVRGTLDQLNRSRISQTKMWTHDNKVYVSLCLGSDTTNSTVLVYDLLASRRTGDEAWTTYTGWSIDFFLSYPANQAFELYLANKTTKKVYTHSGNTDDGTTISSTWTGKDHDFDYPDILKRQRYGTFRGNAGTNTTVSLKASADGSSFHEVSSLSLTTTGSTLGPTGTDGLGPTGTFTLGGSTASSSDILYDDTGLDIYSKNIQFSIQHTTANTQPVVDGFKTHYKVRGLNY